VFEKQALKKLHGPNVLFNIQATRKSLRAENGDTGERELKLKK